MSRRGRTIDCELIVWLKAVAESIARLDFTIMMICVIDDMMTCDSNPHSTDKVGCAAAPCHSIMMMSYPERFLGAHSTCTVVNAGCSSGESVDSL